VWVSRKLQNSLGGAGKKVMGGQWKSPGIFRVVQSSLLFPFLFPPSILPSLPPSLLPILPFIFSSLPPLPLLLPLPISFFPLAVEEQGRITVLL
jgi:hypothetical protein